MATSRKADEASSSSSSSSSNHWIYEVFLSFRGEDTRKNFTDHLYLALKEAGINAFIDDKLERGEIIDEELMRVIQGSKISVIVFSSRYADSSWCLEELEKIMECRTTLGQLVLPVFYDVDPTDVLKQSGSFGEAFDQKHGDKHEDKVKRWRTALTEAATLSGWDLNTTADGHEGKLIRMIIEEITKYLNNTDLYVADNETGIDSRMQDIISLLDVGTSHDVRIVGICGMGGIGKTTVAKALYNKFRQDFEASSFLRDVRETTMQNNGMVSLQKSLLSDISKTSITEVGHVDRGIILIRERLGCRRVFVVIDDVDKVEQLKALAIDRDSFGRGSIMLITTRNEHLLKQFGEDSIYQVQVMDEEESIRLLSLHAFKTRCPPNEEYLILSRRVVDCCGGLPLALKVLGSFLFDRNTEFWESAIQKLHTIPQPEVHEKLKISFDGLNDDTERDLFLDISCFHIGKAMDYVKPILDSCGLFPDSGIQVLIQRCLVTVNKENQLMMHDLLRDMGREIVRAKCRDNPGKWSRVWHWEDAVEVLRDASGSDEIQGLTLDLWRLNLEKEFKTKAFAKMKSLRFLKLHGVKLIGQCKYLPKKLRWLDWNGFPLEFIPKEFSLGEAVAIHLRGSNLRHVWEDSGLLAKLKILDLSCSFSLKQSPDFSTIPNLEKLVLNSCEQLAEVHQSIGRLKRLSFVDLKDCKILEELPRSFYKLKSVETLVLDGCERFKKLHEEIGDMTSLSTLNANCTAITELPSSIVRLKNLSCLHLQSWDPTDADWEGITLKSLMSTPNFRILNLPPSVQGLSSLVDLSINCCIITNVPKDLGSLSSLESLDIRHCYLQSLPSLSALSQLVYLRLLDCNLTDELIRVMDLGSLSSLKLLHLDDNSFSSLPSLRSLSKLVNLSLRSCTNLVAIPDLPTSLKNICASDCTALKIMPDFSDMSNMRQMCLDGCAKLVEVLGLDESLKSSMTLLELGGCTDLTATFKEKILQVSLSLKIILLLLLAWYRDGIS
ncbi:disease resistance protein RUN1-like [Rosa rugosa]|uniref:disease resistance protein RUN1-like n=1 Tax=Rosa rugosa TaxID=74645 RepID=UPI002B402A9D|nr:disease resistance protein RUN1-like [Rosa rugosa]